MELANKEHVLAYAEKWGHAYSKMLDQALLLNAEAALDRALSRVAALGTTVHPDQNDRDAMEVGTRAALWMLQDNATRLVQAIEWLDDVEPKMGRGTDESLAHWRTPSGETVAQVHQEMLDAWNLKNTTGEH